MKVPTSPGEFQTWLRDLPLEQQIQAAQYFSSAAARPAAAMEFNRIVSDMVASETYQQVADRFGWTRANVKRRVTDYRRAMGTLRPARRRRVSPDVPEATFRPPE